MRHAKLDRPWRWLVCLDIEYGNVGVSSRASIVGNSALS